MKDMPVIDAHCHLGEYGFLCRDANAENMLLEMDRIGIDKSCIAPIIGTIDVKSANELMLKTVKKYKKRFLGYIFINPNYPEEIEAEINKYKECENVIGIKIHPTVHEYKADDDNYQIMWKTANKNKMIVLSHTWEGDGRCSPGLFVKVAEEYPDVTILLGHSGGTYKGVRESVKAAKKCSNIYLDITSSEAYETWTEDLIKMADVNKIIFGTDSPFISPAYCFGRIYFSNIPLEAKKRILGLNFKKLLESSGR